MDNSIRLPYTRYTLMDNIKKQLGNIEIAMEIGTWRGDFAAVICEKLSPNKFYAVDPFALYEGYTDKPDQTEFANQNNLDVLAARTAQRISSMLPNGKSSLIRDFSCNVVDTFADNSLDVVYIDADHKYDPVLADISAWYPKIKPGGVLCGDDYIDGSHIEKFGVIPAVNDFASQHGLKFAVTSGHNPTWIFCKDSQDLWF